MSIAERTLRKWRKEALKASKGEYPVDTPIILFEGFCERILQMTQELLDLHLLQKK